MRLAGWAPELMGTQQGRGSEEEGIRSTSAIRRVAADRAETNVRVVRGRKGKKEKKGGEEEEREKNVFP